MKGFFNNEFKFNIFVLTALSSPLALRLSVPQKFLAFLQEFDDGDVRILGTQVLASLKIHDGKWIISTGLRDISLHKYVRKLWV